MKTGWYVVVFVFLIGVIFFGIPLYKELTLSVQVEVDDGVMPNSTGLKSQDNTEPDHSKLSTDEITRLLLKAGLNIEPILGDTGISGHLQRLRQGEVSLAELQQYANNLNDLKKYTRQKHGSIPGSFWDVRTSKMRAHHWTEYSIVHEVLQNKWGPYLKLLSLSYGRFKQFKFMEASQKDNALDAALDMFAYVEDYYRAVPFSTLTEHAKEIKGENETILMLWQSVVAGTSRINPLTSKPMFSHSIFSRINVNTMYQYDLGIAMSIGKVWGVSGFAPEFVGMPENNDQIEHLSISIVLQLIMHEPVVVLNGLEEEKVLLGKAPKATAEADMALNHAIHKEFLPYFSKNRMIAVERLRTFLKLGN